jgi:hypothetical protein
MPVDSIVDKTGGLEFPLDPGDFENTLTPLDPTRNRLLSLFATAINYEMTEVWQKVTADLEPNHSLYGTLPIQDTLELQPTPFVMTSRKPGFPFLALYRTGRALWEEHTLEIDKRTQEWGLMYVMPALNVLDQRRFGDMAQAVTAIVRRVIRNHGHKAFENGALQFFQDASGIGAIKLVAQTAVGNAQFAEGPDSPVYFTVICELQTVEYTQDLPEEFPDFEGVDYAVGTGDELQILPRFIEASDDVPVVND